MRKVRVCRNVLGALLGAISIGACGGGGGGGGSGSFAGTWDLSLTRVINDCNANVPTVATNRILVNQDGSRVVVDSGQMVLTGEANEKDGFTVVNIQSSGGCETGASYAFEDASDGDASVGFAIVAKCGQSTCTVAYGGRGVRVNTRHSELNRSEDPAQSIADELRDVAELGIGEDDDRQVEVSSSELAEVVLPSE